jgi:hypothetical protein
MPYHEKIVMYAQKFSCDGLDGIYLYYELAFESQDMPEHFNRCQAIHHLRAVLITSVRALPDALVVQATEHLR